MTRKTSADGAVGAATIAAMNVPVVYRIRQITLAMERWRWLPRDLGQRYIRVNIANFKLMVIENDRVQLAMKVIVGQTYRKTPVFSGKMTYLVLNPYWHVPHNIVVKDKLPQMQKDPGYLAKNNFKIFEGWGAAAKQIDPHTIEWSKITPKTFKYRLRQDPGSNNALGRVKFMFPNEYNIYLHDTPSRELFTKTSRVFSSGCVRLESPIELAEFLLKDDPRWNRETILAAIDKNEERSVTLRQPINVYILYFTVLVDENGQIEFRNDIYGRDKKLAEALQEMLTNGK